MNRYLVVSYDPGQQQWFYDVVFANNEGEATEKLLAVRTYCEDADAHSETGISELRDMLRAGTPEQSEADLRDFAAEISADDGEDETENLASILTEVWDANVPKAVQS